MREQLLSRLQADAFDLTKLGSQRPAAAALAMKRDGKTMALVTNLLNQAQNRRAAFERDRFILAAGDVNNLFALRDAPQRLIHNIELIERGLCGVQLSDAAVD